MLAAVGRRALVPVRVSTAIAMAMLLLTCDRSPAELEPIVQGEYIVAFKDHVQDVPGLARQLATQHNGTILKIWEVALKGFAVRLQEPARVTVARIRAHPDVAGVEASRVQSPEAE